MIHSIRRACRSWISHVFKRSRKSKRPAVNPRHTKLQLESLEDRVVPATVTWMNPLGGDWDTGSNWSTGQAPGSGDDAVINMTGITITHSASNSDLVKSITSQSALSISNGSLSIANSSSLSSLTLSGGTLTGAGTVTVSGLTTWTGGTMSGSGLTVANGGMTISSGGGLELLNGRTLDNNAMVNWTGNGNNIYLANAAVWNNGVNGVLDSQNAGQGIDYNGGAASAFNNAGTFELTTGATTVTVSVPFNNTGSVSVQAGKLSLTGGGADSGTDSFTVSGGATLGFDGGTPSLSASTSVSGAGAGEFGNGTTTFATGTTYDLTGGMTVDGGTVNFNAGASIQGIGTTLSLSSGAVNFSDGAAINVVTLNESSGLLTGSDTVTVSGLTTWTGGTMSGSGLTVANGGMTISSSGGIELLNGRTLDNNAVANWTGNGNNIYLANAAVWNNGVNGVLDSQNAGQGINNNGGAASTFNNAGTFELTTGATTVTVSVPFNNTGSVSVQAGKLSLTGGGADSGPDSFTVAASSTLGFDGGTTSLSASTSVSGAGVGEFGNGTTTFATGSTYDLTGGMTVDGGTVNFNAGASVQGIGTTLSLSSGAVNFSDGAAINVVTLNESSGLLTGSDTVTVSGLTTWTGGTMSGSGLTVANGGMTLSSSGGIELLNGRTLDNNAMANWTGNGNNIYLANAAVWNNGVNGVLDSQNAGQGINNNGGSCFHLQ